MHYHSQHSPFGAFASFTIGLPGSRGGLGQSLSGPAQQDVYVGYRLSTERGGGKEPWNLLPFFEKNAESAAAAFTVEFVKETEPREVTRVLAADDLERKLGWASDEWSHDSFGYRIYSPFSRTEEPTQLTRDAARIAFAPIVVSEISYDNREGNDPVELIFGIGNQEDNFRPLEDSDPNLVGFAFGSRMGYAVNPEDVATRLQGLDVLGEDEVRADHRGLHLLGQQSAVIFRVEPGERKSFPVALGFYRDGIATTGIASSYYYTKLFDNLEDVLTHGLQHSEDYIALAKVRDEELESAAHLSVSQKWIIAQATHSYLGSSQLLWDEKEEKVLWSVNEGEYRMLNTFDLTVDHLFFELDWHPWAVKNTLDLFVDRYSFTDELKVPEGVSSEGGISFTHDMGVCDHFTQKGHSSYECMHLTGCFSHMTMEQLLNWICTAATYFESTQDRAWLKERADIFEQCLLSLQRRDHPNPEERSGLLKFDSGRCGPDGAEITTYDSLDVSLGQARNNLYIAIKTFGAWSLLKKIFGPSGLDKPVLAEESRKAMDLCAGTVCEKFEPEVGMFPAVFEDGNTSRILPAVEGLVFPLYLGLADALKVEYPELFEKLAEHMAHTLKPGVCLDPVTGAWKISSTSNNTWYSKISIAQHVVRKLFAGAEFDEAAFAAADEAHARLQQLAPLGQFAMVDQVHSETGVALGSRYYPRIVTSCLWLRES